MPTLRILAAEGDEFPVPWLAWATLWKPSNQGRRERPMEDLAVVNRRLGTSDLSSRRRPAASHVTGMRYYLDFLHLRWRWESGRGDTRIRGSAGDSESFIYWLHSTQAGVTRCYDHVAFAVWLLARRPTLAAGSWRRMRAAALHGLRIESGEAARSAEALLRAATTAATEQKSQPTVKKSIREDAHAWVHGALLERAKRGSEVARVAAHWLRAGHALGLRPAAWRGARLLPADAGGGPYLCLAGATAPRDGGSEGHRDLYDLAVLPPVVRGSVANLVAAVANAGPCGFDALRRRCTEIASRIRAEFRHHSGRSTTLVPEAAQRLPRRR